MRKKFKNTTLAILLILSIIICIRNANEIGYAITLATERCINVIIPSMFMFMCLTSIAVQCGIHRILGIILYPLSRFVFRINSAHCGIFLISMFSGYPSGIKLLTDALRRHEISQNEFEHLSCFCFASGPAFILGTVSGILYPDTSAGTLCFVSVTAGNIITAILYSFFSPSKKNKIKKPEISFSAENITESVMSSSKAIFQMCSMIIAFSGFLSIAELSGIIDLISSIISSVSKTDSEISNALIASFFEISNLITIPHRTPELLPIISALLSFGGICVLIQVIIISDNLLNVRNFITARAVSAIFSAIICKLISRFFYLGTCFTFSPSVNKCDYGMLPSILLIFMIIILLSSSKDYGQSEKKML